MKNVFFLILICLINKQSQGQQNYCDFEGIKVIHFGVANGIIDSTAINPSPNGVNNSTNCGKYTRSNVLYDNIKLYPEFRLTDITSYESNDSSASKITMKVFTSAPIGTSIELQVGKRSDDSYPSGINSEYRGITEAQNEWHNLIFNYIQSPPGSLTTAAEIDKIIMLFHPNSSASEVFYFDDLTGPPLTPFAVPYIHDPFQLYQNDPNPVKENTEIKFQINSRGLVSLKLFDCLGNPILSLVEKIMNAGTYTIPVKTEKIPNGIYFYVLNKEGYTKARKLIVAK